MSKPKIINQKNFYPYRNFASIYDEYSGFEKARFLILPIPFDSTTSYKTGAREGPNAIINASGFVELYDHETGLEIYKSGIHTLPEVIPHPGNSENMADALYGIAKELLKTKKTIISLGGDHSISLGLIKAHMEGSRAFSVLQLDAHADLRDEYENTKYGSPTPFRRLSELGAKITQVGLRAVAKEEIIYAKRNGIKQFFAEEIIESLNCHSPASRRGNPINRKHWIEEVLAALSDNVYLSFDVDAFDSSIMPATGTPEPGGLDWYTITKLLKEVSSQKKVIGADFVELSPDLGPPACAFTAAKLIYKTMGYILKGKS